MNIDAFYERIKTGEEWMEKKIKDLTIDDLKTEIEKLKSKLKDQEEIINTIENNERFEQTGDFEDNDYDYYKRYRTPLDLAQENRYNIICSIKKKKDICEKIEQCETIKKKYPNGYKRIIRKQASKDVKDRLNREKKAEEVANIINEKNIKTVGVFGKWGTGKSTFLEYLKEKLHKNKIKIIGIKATEYSDQEKIWAYFFVNMKDNIKKDYKLRFCYLLQRIKNNWKKCIMPIISVVMTITMLMILFKYNLFKEFSLMIGIDESTSSFFNVGMSLFATIYFVIKWIFPLISKFIDAARITQDNVLSLLKRDLNEKLGYKIIVKEYIEEITTVWKKYRFIFFVDELDRCNNDTIMSFLEAIQLLENYDNIKIVYAIDVDIVLTAISKSGFYNPHNYLTKYVDMKIDLESINTQSEYITSIASKEYDFSEEEIKEIKLALEDLEINISVRDYFHILNSLSELKERWIKEQVMPEKCKNEELCEGVINWYKSIPIATSYFARSFWPQKIYRDFRTQNHNYNNVHYCTKNIKIEQQYLDCPKFIMETALIDVLNVMKFLRDMPPIYHEKIDDN